VREEGEAQEALEEGPAMTTLRTLLLTLILLALTVSPASAKIVHPVISAFHGEETPSQPLGSLLVSDAVNQSTGDVYVLESNVLPIGIGVVDRFTASGVYAGVQITGAEVPQESFAFGEGSGVAVDNSLGLNSGDVYVADTGHHVVDRFSEAGVFQCQIAGEETEAENPAAKECDSSKSGLSGVIEPAGVAVNSAGDVYVADDAHAAIDEFGPAGNYIRQLKGPDLLGEMGTIAIDPAGNLYVTNLNADVVELTAKGEELVLDSGSSVGVGVDPVHGYVYVGDETQPVHIAQYGQAGELLAVFASSDPLGLAVDGASGDVYVAEFFHQPAIVTIFGPGAVVPNVASEPASGVGETTATLHGSVEPDLVHAGGDVTSCQFEYVTERQFSEHPENPFEGAATGECETATHAHAPYSEPESVSAKVTLQPSTTYHFRVTAADSGGANDGEGETKPEATFTTYGPPAVDSETSTTGATGATLRAQIDPFGYGTSCSLQYVDNHDFQESGYLHAATEPCTPSAIPAGFGDRPATATVTGLGVGMTYHYRFLATNQAKVTFGADETFTTFGVNSFKFEVLAAGGKFNAKGEYEGPAYTQAGGHPYVVISSFAFNSTRTEGGTEGVDANVKDVEMQLPPGLVGNPTAVPTCTRDQLTNFQCSGASQVGVLHIHEARLEYPVPIYNLVPPEGTPAEFGARVNTAANVYIDFNVRTGAGYGFVARVANISTGIGVLSTTAEFWGVPASHEHDAERYCPIPSGNLEQKPCEVNLPLVPFLTSPTVCSGPQTATMRADSWQDPGAFVTESVTLPAFTGCAQLSFTPTVAVAPDTTEADSPSGLHFGLNLPLSEDAEGLAESTVKNTVVTLPVGASLSPSAASGLMACSPEQIGLDDAAPAGCPEASKVGTVEIDTPLLSDPLRGAAYVAEQNNNPFGSTFAIYLAVEADGAHVKLAAQIAANPETGQLVTTFSESPPLPFSKLTLDLFGGPAGVLATPNSCGVFAVATSLGSWSATAPVGLSDAFPISSGCVGGFSPSFTAGSQILQAGAYTPFVASFSRSDTDQELSGLTVTLPPGLLAKVAGVTLCSEAQIHEAQAGTGGCPESSQVGTVQTGVGPGPDPLFVGGKAYLTGPYNGGPYGLAVVVPAVAGPYDFGTVVVRQSLRIDPTTAQVTDVSDPFPKIIDGVPLRLRRIDVTLNGAGGNLNHFTFNPTSCSKEEFTGSITGSPLGAPTTLNGTVGYATEPGATSPFTTPFQVANCAALKFTPKFTASTSGKTSKADGASLTTKVTEPNEPQGSQANIATVKVELPKVLPSRLTTLQRACTARTFEENPAKCPPESRIGYAAVHTPILPDPLTGPAIFVSHGGEAFPSLTIMLQGDNVTIDLVGTTFISKSGVTSTTFETVPDTPFSTFELTLPQGQYSALAANGNLCASNLAMPTELIAQNGAEIHQDTGIAVTGCNTAITVVSHRVKGKTATIQVRVPEAGKLVATAKGLGKASKTAKGATTLTLKLTLTNAQAAFLGKHKTRMLKAKVNLTFSPKNGAKLRTSTTVIIG
jgi:hypothetical protein